LTQDERVFKFFETKIFLAMTLIFQLIQASQEKFSGRLKDDDEIFRSLVYLRESYLGLQPI
jgi:hypothetical protein